MRNNNRIFKWKFASHLKINFHFTINCSNDNLSPICIDRYSGEITANRFIFIHFLTFSAIRIKNENKNNFFKNYYSPNSSL